MLKIYHTAEGKPVTIITLPIFFTVMTPTLILLLFLIAPTTNQTPAKPLGYLF